MATTTRVQVTIVSETEKALRVELEGKQFWIQRRWLNEADSTISKKMADETLAEAEIRETKETRFRFTAARETEKAVMAMMETIDNAGNINVNQVWFPKSQVVDQMLPAWLVDRKVKELGHRGLGAIRSNQYFERVIVDKN